MKKNALIAAMCVGAGLYVTASHAALVIDATTFNFDATPTYGFKAPDNYGTSEKDSINFLNSVSGETFSNGDALYKSNVGGSDEGVASNWYSTEFFDMPDPSGANINWLAGNFIDCLGGSLTCWLTVKDGNNDPTNYVFNLTGLNWDGKEQIQLRNFWTGSGAISHVAIWGGTPTTNVCPEGTIGTPPNCRIPGTGGEVPEPGTLALLGLGMFGLAAARRRMVK